MGRVKELSVRKGVYRRGRRVEYAITVEVDDVHDLYAAREHLEGLLDGWLSSYAEPAEKKAQAQAEKAAEQTLEKVKALFPSDLQQLLAFSQGSSQGKDYWIITPRQFLGSENFSKIADVVRQHGGEYVSAGKDSHFRIPAK